MAYPMGLPEWDVVKTSLDSEDGLKVSKNGKFEPFYKLCF
jgi:hypothetical protein